MASPFSNIPPKEWIAANELAFAVEDRYPVSPGHALVIPRREVATWFDASPEEHRALFALVQEVKARLDAREPRPDGYNVGFNAGEAAGQTVMHLHVHVIPRYLGDMPDPRGGVRHVIPWKGNYLLQLESPLAVGGQADPFFRHMLPLFKRADHIAIVAAFVHDSDLIMLHRLLHDALQRGAHLRILTGDYLRLQQVEALRRLLGWMGEQDRLQVRVVERERLPPGARSFHPKSWIFRGPELEVAFVGSSNLSRSALGAGSEWNLRADGRTEPVTYTRILEKFEDLWLRALPLSAAWVDDYEAQVAAQPVPLSADELDPPPGQIIPLRPRTLARVPCYPDLRAAASAVSKDAPAQDPGALAEDLVALPLSAAAPGAFAVRATGDSMDGGKHPVRSGDWMVMRRLPHVGLAAVEGRVALLQIPGGHEDVSFQVKRVIQEGPRWLLRSDNPAHPPIEATPELVVVAVLEETVRPEQLAPDPGAEFTEEQVPAAFALSAPVPRRSGRWEGHLFLLEGLRELVPPDGVRASEVKPRPGETAYVLLKLPDAPPRWRYLGVARPDPATDLWRCDPPFPA